MQFTVFGAIVSCGSGSNTIRFTPPYRGVSIGDGWVGLESDVSPDYFGGTFGTCAKRKDEDCKECDMCLFDKWFCPNTSVLYLPRVTHAQNSYLDHQNLPALRTVEVDGQAQALLTMNSHLVCRRGDKVSFLTSGQNDPWTFGFRNSRPMSMSGKVYGSGLPDIPVRASNEAHDNKVLWVASQILIAHSWYSTHPRREIVITDKDGLILDRLTEGIDFYVAGSGLSYYINKEENRLKNVFPAAKPGDEPQTYTVTVGDDDGVTPVVLHEGRDYYIGGDGEAYLYNSPRVILEAKGFTLGFDTHSDGSAQITVSGLSERCWFDHGLSALFSGTLTSNIFTQGSQFYISADNQARMMRTKAPPPPVEVEQQIMGVFPVPTGIIESPFGTRNRSSNRHNGLDISAVEGDDVLSIYDGKVVFAPQNQQGGYGHQVKIQSELAGKKVVVSYSHNKGPALVSEDADIKAGEVITKIGNTGSSDGPHVHIEVFIDDELVNPLPQYYAVTSIRQNNLYPYVLDHSIKDTCYIPFYENYPWRDHNQVVHRPE